MSDQNPNALNLDENFHPLFTPIPGGKPDYRAEDFDRIRVFRMTSAGPKQIPREFAPSELPDAETFVNILGGGTFELWAIKLPSNQIYTKRLHTFDAPPKASPLPSAGSTTPPGEAPVAMVGMPPGLDPAMQWFYIQQEAARREEKDRQREEREREERRRDRDEQNRREDRQAQNQLLGTIITAVVPLLAGNKNDGAGDLLKIAEALRALNPPPTSAPVDPSTALNNALDIADKIDKRAAARVPEPPEEGIGKTVSTILEAAGPMLMQLAAPAAAPAASSAGATPVAKVVDVLARVG